MFAPQDPLALYDLEGYLFGTVAERYRSGAAITAFDLFCIVIWKTNRAKSRVAARLLQHPTEPASLEAAVQTLVTSVRSATAPEQQLTLLLEAVSQGGWGLRLPMASAVLTVFMPTTFTIYDERVCATLPQYSRLSTKSRIADTVSGYLNFVDAVAQTGDPSWSLRDKDRALWAHSFRAQLEHDIANAFLVDTGARSSPRAEG